MLKEEQSHMVLVSSARPTGTGHEGTGWLTPGEFALLEDICETLFPSLEPPAGSSAAVAAFYRRSAADLQVARRLAEVLGQENADVQAEFRQFLSLFASPGPALLLAGSLHPFTQLSQERRTRFLLALASSPIGKFRKGYQAIKRLACLIYYAATDAQGHNPNWEILDYTPPPPPPAVPQTIKPLSITRDSTLEADAIVIGSGAGGGVIAAELARAGKSVIVLEKGGYNFEGNFTQLEAQANAELFLKRGTMATSDLGIAILAGCTLGGSTVVNWMTCLRPPQDVLAEWEQLSGLSGYFTGAALQESFAAVEQRLSVHVHPIEHNRPNRILFDGATALGYHADENPRNTRGCAGRCGGCNFGCRYGGSQSALKTYVQDAYNHGARVLVRCSADKVLIEHGRAVGVLARVSDPHSGQACAVTVHAKTVVLAAGALHTPAILLRSGLEHPHIGRHLHLHPTTVSAGLYAEKVYAWKGVLQSAYSDQFVRLDGNYGYKLEAAPGHPGLFALARPWYSARDHREQMMRCSYLAPLIIVTRDKHAGRVTLDRYGEPVVNYVVSAAERKYIEHGLRHGARIHMAAGASEVISLQNRPTYIEPSAHTTRREQQMRAFDRQIRRHGLGVNHVLMFSAHQMGTCRMGANPRTSVVDEHHQVHGIQGLYICDGSVFPSASGVNPMIAIMGLVHRASQHIKAQS
jgi:choline dehydrogenase-like flavoprotein